MDGAYRLMLRRYLSRMFLARVLGSLLGLVAIAQLLDLLDKTGPLLTRGGVAAIGRYEMMRMPATIAEMLALATLIGGLVTFTRLARSLEMTVIGAAGVSLRQVLGALLPACLALCAAQFVFQAEFAPRAERAVADWWARTAPPGEIEDPQPTLWLRIGPDLVHLDHVSLDGRAADGVEILHRDAQGELASWITASRARWAETRWTLLDATVMPTTPGADARHRDTLDWTTGPLPRNLVALSRPVETQSLDRLVAITLGSWIGARGPRYETTQIEALLAGVLDPLVMVLLALPLVVVPPRSETASLSLMRTLALGLGYLAAAGLLDALGNAGTLPGPVAAWAAVLVFAGLGWVRIHAADL